MRKWPGWLALAATAAVLACAPPEARPGRLAFIALTDLHVDADSDLTRLRQFLYTVRDQGSFVLITGDICGHAPEYLEPVREIASHAPLPVYLLPGNHDDNYARSPEWWSGVFGPLARTFEAEGYEFLLNWSQDSLGCAQWLDSVLAVTPPGRRLVYAQHYPPGKFGDAALPLIEPRAADFVLSLSGHTHTHNLDTLDCGLISLTMENCYMHATREGRYYELTLDSGELAGQRSFAFDSLAFDSLPDRAPTVAFVDTSVCINVDRPLSLAGTASDDQGLAQLQYRLDWGPWIDLPAAGSFTVELDPAALTPGHHLVLVRARDLAGNLSDGFARATLYVPEPEPPAGTVELWNGREGYAGCRDITVRAHQHERVCAGDDLECWNHGQAERLMYSEIYLAFDLSGVRPPKGARLAGAELTLFCSFQNSLSPQDGYRVEVAGGDWDETISFDTRPARPGWSAADSAGALEAPLSGQWTKLDGRIYVRPEVPMHLDLTPFLPLIQSWLEHPERNHGWVIAPRDQKYVVSFRSSECPVPTMRPRLSLSFE